MDITKKKAVNAAFALGFDDIKFVTLGDAAAAPYTEDWISDASCVAVLFKAYRPGQKPPEGYMALSPYYAASHFAYHAAKAFAAWLQAHGVKALHTAELPAQKTALKSGGFMGDNGFYYHPSLGSLVCIQTVITDAFTPDPPQAGETGCRHCGVCTAACPSGAVGNISNCLRRYLGSAPVPETLRGDVYQLLGCERCQTVCPLNTRETAKTFLFPLESLLSGDMTKKLQELAGAGMARKSRILSQAALHAANTNQKEFADKLLELSQTAPEPVRTHARWAYDKLTEDK